MASLLIERMPSVERVRFLVSGTEANLLAMRLARAYTGRIKLAKAEGSYHGHADHMVVGSSTVGIAPNEVPAGVVAERRRGARGDPVQRPRRRRGDPRARGGRASPPCWSSRCRARPG